MTFLNSMTLSAKNKRWLGEHLIEQAVEEERKAKGNHSKSKVYKVKRWAADTPSDAELEERFRGTEMPVMPEDPDWNQVISANTGRTIKPIEKWL